MHNFCFAVPSCFLFRLQLALFNTSFRHVICAHTPRRALLQERSERCSHKEEEEEEETIQGRYNLRNNSNINQANNLDDSMKDLT